MDTSIYPLPTRIWMW